MKPDPDLDHDDAAHVSTPHSRSPSPNVVRRSQTITLSSDEEVDQINELASVSASTGEECDEFWTLKHAPGSSNASVGVREAVNSVQLALFLPIFCVTV